jgi:Holliday junction resolvasome RuvABC endonuclease subunit
VTPLVLGIDVGLATCGWAVVELLAEGGLRLGPLGVIRTQKAKTKGTLATDDLHRRGQELARALAHVLDSWPPVCVCAESISYPRNAATSAMIGRAWGVLDAELQRRGHALISASPKAIKKAATGKQSASKEEVIAALDARTDGALRRQLAGIRAKTMHEHPADALGAVVACLDHDHMRLARAAWTASQGAA